MCSRREAEAFIADGLVRIDGEAIRDAGHKIAPGQTLALADRAETPFSAVLNKPIGYVSAQPERGQIPAARLLTKDALWVSGAAIPKRDQKLAPLGRLDRDSRGLLILSEDGVLAKALIGPESEIDKEYQVRVTGTITPRKIALLRHGLMLDGRALKPAQVTQTGPQRLTFILTEGRNRQIRRMAEAVELHVTDLKRVRIGALTLGHLPEGSWRALSAAERDALMCAPEPPP